MLEYIIPVHVTVNTSAVLDDVANEIEGGLQDALDSNELPESTNWGLGEAIPAGPFATLVEKAKAASYVRLAGAIDLWYPDAEGTKLLQPGHVYLRHIAKDLVTYADEADLTGATFYRLTEF